jgi:hypothetical protein
VSAPRSWEFGLAAAGAGKSATKEKMITAQRKFAREKISVLLSGFVLSISSPIKSEGPSRLIFKKDY